MFASETHRPTWAEINLDNLAFNFKSVKNFVGEGVKYMAVVKADGYGHGAVECARRLEAEGVDWFGVALPEEGAELRRAGIRKLVLCLGGFWAGQEELLLNNNLTPVIYQIEKAAAYDGVLKRRGTVAAVHVKIDTGMGRIGVRYDEVREFAEKLKEFGSLRVEGLMTHFAAADDPAENSFTELQIKRFERSVKIFEEKGFRPAYKDLANSPGAIARRDARGNMVRLGGVLYGLGGDVLPPEIAKPVLRPVMSLRTRVANLKKVPPGETLGYGRTFTTHRDSLIAVVPIGYEDGYRRSLSSSAKAIVGGAFAAVAGRVSMDWTILDVTDVPGVKVNDEVILIGEAGGLRITTEELAAAAGTISYEITCGINRRVTRTYVGSKKNSLV